MDNDSDSKNDNRRYSPIPVSVFGDIKCEEFVQSKLIYTSINTSFYEAINILKTNQISAMPVYDEQIDEYVHLISHTDLTMTALSFVEEAKKTGNYNDQNQLIDNVLKKMTLRIIPRSGLVPSVNKHDHISVAIRMFQSVHHKQLHRICIKDKNKVVGVLSQLDLLRYIYQNIDRVPDKLLNSTIKELFQNLPSAGLTTIKSNATVLDAMRLLHKENTHCLCVVDADKGTFISGFSFSSVRYLLSTKAFSILNKSVLEFTNEIQKADNEQRLVLMQIEPNYKVQDVLRRVVECGFHRIFVTDSKFLPKDVITLTDLLRLFY